MVVTCCCTYQLNMTLTISGGSNCPVAYPLVAGPPKGFTDPRLRTPDVGMA